MGVENNESEPIEPDHRQYDTEAVNATEADADFEAEETNRKDGSA